MRFYWIEPISQFLTKSRLFGYFGFKPCECGCTTNSGKGFNFGIFGVNWGIK